MFLTIKVGNTYIPVHTITQIVIEGFQAYIWTGGDKYRFRITGKENLQNLRNFCNQTALELGPAGVEG